MRRIVRARRPDQSLKTHALPSTMSMTPSGNEMTRFGQDFQLSLPADDADYYEESAALRVPIASG